MTTSDRAASSTTLTGTPMFRAAAAGAPQQADLAERNGPAADDKAVATVDVTEQRKVTHCVSGPIFFGKQKQLNAANVAMVQPRDNR